MQTVIVVFHIFIAIGLIGLILIQHGKGADAGAAFGSGASATVFGARGSASFLTRATAGLATLFFISSMTLGYFASQTGKAPGLMDVPVQEPAPAAVETVEVQPLSEIPPAPPSGSPLEPAGEVPAPVGEAGTDVPEPPKVAE